MSGKLDQSLEDILKTRKQARGRAQGKRVGGRAASNGDVKMTDAGSRVAKPSAKSKPSRNAPRTVAPTVPLQKPIGESKIIVSGLPPDVGETQIQDYFSKTIGPVKRAFLTYGPNGQSKGIATITFKQANSGHEAASKLNGVRVDNRAMKIEVVLGANQAPIPAGLGDRIKSTSRPIPTKAQPKSAAATKTARGRAAAGAAKPKRGRNAGRPKPKTSEELDAEMTDYFVPKDSSNDVNGAAGVAAPVSGDAAMDDQIL